MNKTWKTILQVAGYVLAAILGAFGGQTEAVQTFMQ